MGWTQPSSEEPTRPAHVRGPEPTLATTLWLYDLEPSHALPTLDLARTVQSEFYSARMNIAYRIVRRHPGLLMLAYMATTVSYLASLMTSATAGGYIAVIGAVVGLPGNFLSLGQLRYDILKLLFGCFDMWFQCLILWFVFTVLGFMLGDLRATIVVSFWLGSWPNTCNDAVLVGIRPIVVFSVICIFTSMFIVVSVNSNSIDGLRDFQVLRYGANALPARAAVTDGFGAVAALMMRNVYRRRVLFQARSCSVDLECVIYRCRLRLVRHDRTRPLLDTQCTRSTVDGGSRANIQQMRFIPIQKKIDARRTLAPTAFSIVSAYPWSVWAWYVLTSVAALFTIATTIMTIVSTANPYYLTITCTAFALTAANSIISTCLFQRQLLRVICTSFDFIFLATQLTVLHVCACDLFEWRRSAVLLGSQSWQWTMWVLLQDALTPLVKTSFRMVRHLPSVIYVCSLSAACVLVYMMIFSPTPAPMVDRVIWNGVVMGQPVTFRVLPQFFSTLAMSFAYMLRFCWRQLQFAESDLVVIDGTVVFTNSFARSKVNRVRIDRDPAQVPRHTKS